MSESSKVVSLSEKSGARIPSSTGKPAVLPSAVAMLKEKATSQLLEQIKALFGKVDDSLFAMAERAHGQEEQDGLFQALRLLRVERRNIAERFIQNVSRAFQVRQEEQAVSSFASDNLSLVHNDDLEQLVAADTMVANAKRDFAEPLTELCVRLDTLYAVKVYDKNNPLGPDVICDAFVDAIQEMDLFIHARLTLLKKFEQVVMLHLRDFYEFCNQLLVEQGVLPSLREQQRAARQRSVYSAPQAPGAAGTSGGIPAGSAVPTGAQIPLGGAPVSGHLPPGLIPAAAGVAPMPAGDLLSHLGALQSGSHYQGASAIQLLNVGELLQQRLVDSNQAASLAKVDSDVIKLVEMLFSFILEDRSLATQIKSQLGRLQLPLLKVAIADKSFFSKGGHPARKLLNELADAATGWQAGENYETDSLYCEISNIVEQVLNGFDRDINVFSVLLESLREFIVRERKRAEMLERRVVDEADGRAKTQAARARVAAVMDALVAERDLPQVVQDWLQKVWNNVLFLTCVKEGTESDAWNRDVRTARDLVWSVRAPMPDSRKQLLSLLPVLQERLREGVEALSYNAFETRTLFSGLKEVYRERFALAQQLAEERERAVAEQVAREVRAATTVEPEATIAEEQAAQPLVQTAAPEPVKPLAAGISAEESAPSGALEAAAEPLVAEPEEAAVPQMEELEQAVAKAEVAAPEQDGLAPLEETDPHWQMTFRLAQGSWFELKRSEDEQFRCRLAAVIRDIDQFIFVNRNGAKVAEFARLELAHALRSAQLLPLDDGMLFERALQSVIGNVRKKRSEQR
ncbi:DUF1631 domain-containing protein [Microbulbifer sp. OS29]|uniref:DUF1631 domain-containing protein n=1 Tax=Microbulbifer okhotskensis TaxID=2926617 RepID=A0A9X2J5A9_9GAMM|nr:DUF1631 domain-containing protein [Microbulbifer okhotskensis]MCO1334184.1 DUF1631 domain-containing protein [Microbulbifer okhotskensis]